MYVKFKQIVLNNLFLILLIAIVIFGLILPQPGIIMKEKGALSPMIFVVMFISSFGLPFQHLKGSFKQYNSIIFCFVCVFFLFPLITLLLCSIFNVIGSDLYVGSMVMSVQATTLSSAIIITMTAGGNVSLAMIMTIINNIASAFLSPMLLNLFFSMNDITFDVTGMILELIVVLLLPVVLGQIARLVFKKYVDSVNKTRNIMAQGIVLLIILTGVSAAAEQMLGNFVQVVYITLFATLVHVVIVIIPIVYARFTGIEQKSKIALVFCSSQKTLPASLLVWGNYFPEFSSAPIYIVVYHIIAILIDSFLADRYSQQQNQQVGELATN